MRGSRFSGMAAAAVSLMAFAAIAFAAVTIQRVRGDLAPTDEASEAEGRFRITSRVRDDQLRESVRIRVRGLDVTTDEAGELPTLALWMIDSEGTAAELGDLRRSSRGHARFSFRSNRDTYPDGVDALRDFGGGTIEVRDSDGAVVLAGSVPAFADLDDEIGEDQSAATIGFAGASLTSTDETSEALGRVLVQRRNSSRGMSEALSISARGLDDEAGDHTAIAIDADGNETILGTMTVRGRRGFGWLGLSTRRGDELPVGVDALANQTLEIRDGEGVVVLSGIVPVIQ